MTSKVEISVPELGMAFTVVYTQIGSHHTVSVENYAHMIVWTETFVAMEGDKNETVQFIKSNLAEVGLAMALAGATFVSNGKLYGFETVKTTAGTPAHVEVWTQDTPLLGETWIKYDKYFNPWDQRPLSVKIKEAFESL